MVTHPPRPRFALAVGIIGHQPNRLPSEQSKLDAISAEIAAVLGAIGREAVAAHAKYAEYFCDKPPAIAVISALAEGADRIAAHAAIALEQTVADGNGAGAKFKLDVPLPFSAGDYKDDFSTDESRSEFDVLLKQARSVLALPGERGRSDEPKQQAALRQNRSYEDAGLTLLNQSDLILAVWDGGASAGRGGTRELLDIAARSGTPVIHIDAKCALPTRLRWDGLDQFPTASNAVDDLPAENLSAALPRVIDELVRPPEEKKSASQAGEPAKQIGKRKAQADLERQRLRCYYDSRLWSRNFGLAFPALMALFEVRQRRDTDWRPPAPEDLSAQLVDFDKSEPPNAKLQKASVLATAFGWADAWGVWLAQVFRSAFVMNFSFAAFAVTAAAVSLVWNDIVKLLAGDGTFDMTAAASKLAEHKLPFVLTELFFLLFAVVLTVVGYNSRWHHRWLEAREVAERLRIAFPLWALGLRPATFPAEEPAWTGWYTRAIVREQGMRRATLDAAGLQQACATLRGVLSDQCNYHRTTAVRMAKMEKRLERAGFSLFVLTLLALIAFLIAVFAHVHVSTWTSFSVTAVAAGLPALGTAMFGIRVIGDFDGIARRSERTHQVLQRIIDAIDAEDPPSLTTLRARARAASDVMLGDVSSWRLAAESRTLAIYS
jgi:hypothetical protein